jgi:PAS domain S-box-containing protein
MQIPPGLKISALLQRDLILYQGDVDPGLAEQMLAEGEPSLLVTISKGKPGQIFYADKKMLPSPGKHKQIVRPIAGYKIVPEEELLEAVLPYLDKTPFLLAVDPEKNPCGYITAAQLIRTLLEGLDELQQLVDTVLEASEEIITIADHQHKVLYWNKKAETFYGIKKKDILGHDLKSFFPTLVLTKVLASGKPVFEAYHQPKPGLYVLINSLPIKAGSKLLGGVSLERDITEMVNLNRELNKATTRLSLLQQEMDQIEISANGPFTTIHGHSPRLKDSIEIARKVAMTNAAVLIRGESGTGKELFAKAIHQASARRNKPFIAINCGAIPPTLFESELFGYEPGAFTGAEKSGKQGRFELADGGTLFLDEIGEMDFAMQVKLLRVLQDNIFFRVGGAKPVKVDVRIIAATNKDLEEMMAEARFRRDLYYRLNVVSLEIPPLQMRKGDIPELVYLFINEFSKNHSKEITEVAPDLMTVLLKYDWPGNVRELRNVIERLVVLTEGSCIDRHFLPKNILDSTAEERSHNTGSTLLTEITSDVERKTIVKALQDVQGNKSKAAKALGMPRSTFYYKLHKLGLE